MFKHEEKVILRLLLKYHDYDFLNDEFKNDEELNKLWPKMFIYCKYTWNNVYINQYKIHNKILKILNNLIDQKYVKKQTIWLNWIWFWDLTRAKKMNSYYLSDTFNRLLEKYPTIMID